MFLHLRFHGYRDDVWSDAAVRRYARDAGPLLEELNELTRCDCTTRNERKARLLAARMDALEERIAELREREALDAIRPDIDGNRVMELLGIGPGRAVGEALDMLLEARLDEGPLGEAEAERRVLAWWARRQRGPADPVGAAGASTLLVRRGPAAPLSAKRKVAGPGVSPAVLGWPVSGARGASVSPRQGLCDRVPITNKDRVTAGS